MPASDVEILNFSEAVALLQKKIAEYKATHQVEQCTHASSALTCIQGAWSQRLSSRYYGSTWYAAVYNVAVLAMVLWTTRLLYRRARLIMVRQRLHAQYVKLCRTNAEVREEKRRLHLSSRGASRQYAHVLHCVAIKAVIATLVLVLFTYLPDLTRIILANALFHWVGDVVPSIPYRSTTAASTSWSPSWSLLHPLTWQSIVSKLATRTHVYQSVYLWYCFGSVIFTTIKLLLDSMLDNVIALVHSVETRKRGRTSLLDRIDASICLEQKEKQDTCLQERLADMYDRQANLQAAIEQLSENAPSIIDRKIESHQGE